MHRVIKNTEPAAEVLDDALQTKTHAKYGNARIDGGTDAGTESELVGVLTAILTSDLFDKRFLSVDGLDEATSDTQFDILDTLSGLPINILFTSRPLPLLRDCVPHGTFFDIMVRDTDIRRLVEEKARGMRTLTKLLEQDGWREKVVKAVLEKSSGM